MPALDRMLADFDPQQAIECSWTPPSSWYLEPAFLEAEKEGVFHGHWLYLGAAAELEQPGDFVTYQVIDQPVVVTMAEDGERRAFYNVCRHHAACVAEGKGNAPTLTCPYHGWAYRLDGSLRRAPRLGQLSNFDVKEFGLKPIALEVWGGLMFAHLGNPKQSIAEYFDGIERYLRVDDLASLKYVGRKEYVLECNWKVFSDNYLEVPFDLSSVMFITTANVLDTIPPALRDRMEVLDLTGYTEDEKLMIAKQYLVPRQLVAHGIASENLAFDDGAIRAIIGEYTREAGLRNLEREVATICRSCAKEYARGNREAVTVTREMLKSFLGPVKFFAEVAERTSRCFLAGALPLSYRLSASGIRTRNHLIHSEVRNVYAPLPFSVLAVERTSRDSL